MGLVVATSIGITLNAGLTIAVYRRRAGALPMRGVARALARALAFGALTGGAAWWASRAARAPFDLETNLGALACLCAGAAAWLAVAAPLIALTRPPELMFAIDKIARKLKLKRG
jgi:peptidoglycan biosynthesis protein MviN/MurJ (putative lipid II flippase)